MADAEDWSRLLQDHPIFSPSSLNKSNFLELSTLSLRDSTNVDSSDTGSSTSGRRQTMILKDADLIVAAGKEIRMSSFGDIKLSKSIRKSYKVCRSTLFLSPENFTISFRHCIRQTYNSRYVKYPSILVENYSPLLEYIKLQSLSYLVQDIVDLSQK